MTEIGNRENAVKRTAQKKRSAGAPASKTPARDEYDAFLEAAARDERASSQKARSMGKSAKTPAYSAGARSATKKSASSASKSAGSASAKSASSKSKARQKPVSRGSAKPASGAVKRDPYDDYLMEAQRPPKKRASRRKKGAADALTLLLAGAIVCILLLGAWQMTQYRTFLTMKNAVDRATFYDGTYVDGINVSSMSLSQALEYWTNDVETAYSQRKVTLSNGATFTAEELGYSSDYVTVLNAAWNAGRSGSLEERYAALSHRKNQTANYTVTRTDYREENIDQCVAAIAEQIDRPAENAKIASFDTTDYTFQFTDEVLGSQLDTQQLKADMVQALASGGGTVELIVHAIQPEVVKEDIAGQYGMIASAVTNASSSSSNRLSNIKLAVELINGICLKPGETFSFNETVGERTTARGFKSAAAYSSGTVVNEVGGGICQVSTTLFNAAVKADLEIVERHNHSLTVSYVDRGKDAAVDWGNKDLRFTNTSDDDIYICCVVDSSKRVRFGIFGKLLPDGETITVEAKTTEYISYETEYVYNTELPTGTMQVKQSGKDGYRAVAYKVRWDKDGNEISREQLCKSTYRATAQIIEVGP